MIFSTVDVGSAIAKPTLPPEPPNFTLDAALTTALRYNPAIQIAEARVVQARLEKENQDLWWARTIRANLNYAMLGNNPAYGGTLTPDGTVLPTAAVGIGLNLGELLAGPKNSGRADQAMIIAEAELRRMTLDVANATTVAFEEYQAAKQVITFADGMIDAAETDVRIAERQFARGATAVNSLVGARLAVQRVRADSITHGGGVAKAWTQLLALMGDPAWLEQKRDAANAERR